jgi:hypothetical protein
MQGPQQRQGPQPPTKEETRRVEDCMEAIKAILEEYKVQMIPLITLGPGGVVNATIQGHAIPEQRRIIVPDINAKKVVDEIIKDQKGKE